MTTSIHDRSQHVLSQIWEQVNRPPIQISIPPERVDGGSDAPFQPHTHYFQVRVNEMYLSKRREWFTTYDPLVFAVTEFIYHRRHVSLPFVVGPTMLESYGRQLPIGMLFSNTRIAGPYPYRGGRIALAVVLYRVRRDNAIRNVLRLLEKVAGVVDVANMVHAYIRIADVLLEGMETLLGANATEPRIGVRIELDPAASGAIHPGYYALLDPQATRVNPEHLRVRNEQLWYGSEANAEPYRASDYVLYSLTRSDQRSDVTTLPFYPLYEQTLAAAISPDATNWKRARINLLTLIQNIELSPDLTITQARSLSRESITRVTNAHQQAARLGTLGSTPRTANRTDSELTAQAQHRLAQLATYLEL